MTRKIIPLVFIGLLLSASFGGGMSSNNKLPLSYYIKGSTIWDSEDGKVEIYNDTTGEWNPTCKITVYSLDRSIPPAVNNGSKDEGRNGENYDEFKFDAGWREQHDGKAGVAVGEAEANSKSYVFITDFVYAYYPTECIGDCNETRWEPLPRVEIYLKKNSIELTIPKFSHPTNRGNAIGFAVFRDNMYIGSTTTELATGTGYFFTDSFAEPYQYDQRNYSVAPITKGNFYVAAPETPEPEVILKTPVGGERWGGGYQHTIAYEILYGLGPYNVNLGFYKEDAFQPINETAVVFPGNYSYNWTPLEERDIYTVVRINVTDGLGRYSEEYSPFFTIDCTAPEVEVLNVTPTGSEVDLRDDIVIKFSEGMNTTSVENALSITPEIEILNKVWEEGDRRLRIEHSGFAQNQTYWCNLTTNAKDASIPGNYLLSLYPHSFKTTPGIWVSIDYPEGDKIYTGNRSLIIKYYVGGGIAPYNITIQFFNGSAWVNETTRTNISYEDIYSWFVPKLDLNNTQLKLTARDSIFPLSEEREKVVTFAIDSTKPTVVNYTGWEGMLLTTEEIWVTFSEPMNSSSAENSSKLTKITGEAVDVGYRWNDDKTLVIMPKTALEIETNYTACINTTAKDRSIPGNPLKENVTWNFTAVLGQGDFIVDIAFPLAPKKGDKGEIKVSLYNAGEKASNWSGEIKVWFYELKNGDRILLEERTLGRLQKGQNIVTSCNVLFEEARSYQFLVIVDSTNPMDMFNKKGYERASASITVEEARELGVGPYMLIALMVIIVVVIGLLVIAGQKKEMKKKEEVEELKEEESE